MRSAADLDRHKAVELGNAVIHVNNQVTVTKAGRLGEEVLRLEPVPRWPVQPVAQNILLCDDSIIGFWIVGRHNNYL